MIQGYRTEALQAARQQAQRNLNDPMPWVAIAKYSLEEANDPDFRRATQTLVQRFSAFLRIRTATRYSPLRRTSCTGSTS